MSKPEKTKGATTEAKRELERLFGEDEEETFTGFDRIRLRLVARQYQKSNLLYRMFFDKHYRPDRYNCIVNQINQHQNVNLFRSEVMTKYHRFPGASQDFLRLGGHKTDVG